MYLKNNNYVIVLPPIKSRILPKVGTVSPIKSKIAKVKVLNAHLFQLNSKEM